MKKKNEVALTYSKRPDKPLAVYDEGNKGKEIAWIYIDGEIHYIETVSEEVATAVKDLANRWKNTALLESWKKLHNEDYFITRSDGKTYLSRSFYGLEPEIGTPIEDVYAWFDSEFTDGGLEGLLHVMETMERYSPLMKLIYC